MNIRRNTIFCTVLLLALAFLLLLQGCDRSRNNPGWDYFPDMFYSTAYESYTENPNFNDDMTMRMPEEGTVSREFTPFNYTLDPDSRIKAGNELLNPFIANEATLTTGKTQYVIFCSLCHGDRGDGKGFLYTSGLYPLQPRPLTGDIVRNLKDGEIYHTITLGFGSMGAHGSQVKPDDRWKIILYIRQMQSEN